MVAIAVESAAGGPHNQDRAAYFAHPSGVVIVVADGAGGCGGGEAAAVRLLSFVRSELAKYPRLTSNSCVRALERADEVIVRDALAGESTGVVVVVEDENLFGASVGDSAARLIQGDSQLDLTENQSRKPLLGTGAASARPFGPVPFRGTLIVGTDGLFNYVKPSAFLSARVGGVEALAASLVETARLPSGAFHDDLTVVVSRLEDCSRPD